LIVDSIVDELNIIEMELPNLGEDKDLKRKLKYVR